MLGELGEKIDQAQKTFLLIISHLKIHVSLYLCKLLQAYHCSILEYSKTILDQYFAHAFKLTLKKLHINQRITTIKVHKHLLLFFNSNIYTTLPYVESVETSRKKKKITKKRTCGNDHENCKAIMHFSFTLLVPHLSVPWKSCQFGAHHLMQSVLHNSRSHWYIA